MAASPRHYLLICIGFALAALGTIGAINYVVDPYGLYHDGKPWDWPHHRAGISHFLYGFKARAVEEAKPDVVILGRSRVLYGIDPNHAGLPAATYNLGGEGAGIYVNWRYLQHAAAFHLPKTVIMGIDLQSFDFDDPIPSEFSEERLAVNAEGQPNHLGRFADLGSTLFSATALYYSVKSISSSSSKLDFSFDKGYQGDAMLNLDHLDLARNVLAANRLFLVPHVYRARGPGGPNPAMAAFAKIVNFCAAHHIHLIVFVQPLHAAMSDLYTADWNGYSQWMKDVVATLESVPAGQNELWDFTGYNNMTTESFPAATDTVSHMRYFWECSHFRSNVGDLVLSRILNAPVPGPFGQLVNSGNVQADLDRIQAEKQAWHQHGRAVWVDGVIAPADPAPK